MGPVMKTSSVLVLLALVAGVGLSQINALLLPAATVAGLLFLFWLAGRRFLLGVPIVLYMGACLVVVIVGVLVSITQAAHLGDRNASSRISHQRRRARQRRP